MNGTNIKDTPNINVLKSRKFVGILRLKHMDSNTLWTRTEPDNLLNDLLRSAPEK